MLYDPAKQLGCNVKFFFGVLRKILVLFKQVFDHTVEDLALTLNSGLLEPLEQIQDFINRHGGVRGVIVDPLEVGVGLVLHLLGDGAGDLGEEVGDVADAGLHLLYGTRRGGCTACCCRGWVTEKRQ